MSTTINRRNFLMSVGALAAALPLGASAFDFVPGKGKGFNFMLLGDLHYDKLEHHDMEYVKAKYPKDIVQIQNYSRITQDNFPLMMAAAKDRAAEVNADFWLQLGDFVEGLCGSQELANKQTNDFITYIADMKLKRPFFVVKGNHDITGEGAREVYASTVLSWQEKALKKRVPTANTTFVHKNTRFIIFDCYSADQSLEWLKGVLVTHKEELLIFSVHQPVVPYNARSNWHVFAKASQKEKREELLNLLGEHHAIVLTGHLHKTSILTRDTAKGRFVQVAVSSVVEDIKGPARDHLSGLDAYSGDLVKLEPSFSSASLQERMDNLAAEKPFIRHFEYADLAGYASMSVSDKNEVSVSIYPNAERKNWTTVNLTELLRNA